jgi:hypothetical protein
MKGKHYMTSNKSSSLNLLKLDWSRTKTIQIIVKERNSKGKIVKKYESTPRGTGTPSRPRAENLKAIELIKEIHIGCISLGKKEYYLKQLCMFFEHDIETVSRLFLENLRRPEEPNKDRFHVRECKLMATKLLKGILMDTYDPFYTMSDPNFDPAAHLGGYLFKLDWGKFKDEDGIIKREPGALKFSKSGMLYKKLRDKARVTGYNKYNCTNEDCFWEEDILVKPKDVMLGCPHCGGDDTLELVSDGDHAKLFEFPEAEATENMVSYVTSERESGTEREHGEVYDGSDTVTTSQGSSSEFSRRMARGPDQAYDYRKIIDEFLLDAKVRILARLTLEEGYVFQHRNLLNEKGKKRHTIKEIADNLGVTEYRVGRIQSDLSDKLNRMGFHDLLNVYQNKGRADGRDYIQEVFDKINKNQEDKDE